MGRTIGRTCAAAALLAALALTASGCSLLPGSSGRPAAKAAAEATGEQTIVESLSRFATVAQQGLQEYDTDNIVQ
jgi:hypothetical protein